MTEQKPPTDQQRTDTALAAMLKATGKPHSFPGGGNGPLPAETPQVAAIMDDVERLARHLDGIGAEVEALGHAYRRECQHLAVAFRQRTEDLIAKLVRLSKP